MIAWLPLTAGAFADRPDPTEVKRTLEEVFSRPEFTKEPGILERIGKWLSDRFPDLPKFGGTGGGFGGGIWTVLGYLLLIAMAVGVVVLIVYAVRHWISGPRRKKSGPKIESVEDENRSASDWRSDAEAHEASGDWIAALRARYRELVMALIEQGHVPSMPGRTTGELRVDVREHLPVVADDFDGLTVTFENAWYGGIAVSSQQYDVAKAECERVLREANSHKREAESAAKPVVVTVVSQ